MPLCRRRPHAEVAPIAAAFLAAGPGSPTAAAAGGSAPSLYVVTSDGLLTRHLLRAPPAPDGAAAPAAAAGGLDRQDSAAVGAASVAAAVLEEADRWDVARHSSWPEREEPLPGLAAAAEAQPPPPPGAAPAAAAEQQAWVAQAQSGALAALGAALPLWRDPQFRFYELHLQHLQQQRGVGGGGAPEAGTADGLAAEMQAASLADGPSDGGGTWLESVPARAVSQPQQ